MKKWLKMGSNESVRARTHYAQRTFSSRNYYLTTDAVYISLSLSLFLPEEKNREKKIKMISIINNLPAFLLLSWREIRIDTTAA